MPRIYAQHYTNLALKGGGIRGIAYIGAVKVLEEKGMLKDIEKIGGTSIGAVVGVMMCTGMTTAQMEQKMLDIDISSFNDGEWFFIGGQRRLRKHFGWYKGKEFERWVGDIIKQQTGNEAITFMQLHVLAQNNRKYKDPYITATNLTLQRLEIFSWETSPNMPVQLAVRASVSIPLYYGAVCIDSAGRLVDETSDGGHYNVYVDGGLLANYPVSIFNTEQENAAGIINEHTLGLKLERPEQIVYQESNKGIAPYNIYTFSNYMAALYNVTMEQLNKRLSYAEERKHTVYISTGNISPRVRHITDLQKKILFDNGLNAAKEFLVNTH
ncbi:patatin-like phospholipase family protein [Flavipsychrobacter stenotrophus]|uniref:patatin-like phospholipase family protein n=1 Tax=Flavipsychrobacter stenotrophus TaxID=2077091 RepID=UPI001374FD86|nr:patatin-like phospholipase family protein [Flavipsychrobacter stenotrophus]